MENQRLRINKIYLSKSFYLSTGGAIEKKTDLMSKSDEFNRVRNMTRTE